MTHQEQRLLSKIAQITKETMNPEGGQSSRRVFAPNQVSNSDQLLLGAWAIIVLETSTSSLSFRSSELSQPI